jgi:hypothetical protein
MITARTKQPDRAPVVVAPTIKNTDECATRLHDLCGPLLLYYKLNHQLPATLDQLRRTPGFDPGQELACPVSKRPYTYNPIGIMTQDRQPRINLYDPAPSHAGFRWAVSIIEPKEEDGPLITKVVALPESAFTFQPVSPKAR